MDSETRIIDTLRRLVREAREGTGEMPRLTLRQIADLCDVQYDRLWRFSRERDPSDTISLGDAERIHVKLTGKPLFRVFK